MSDRSLTDEDLTGRQFSIKELTQMMLQGMGNQVMKYLKTLPKEEMQRIRQKLIRSLEVIQQKNKRKKEDQAAGRDITPGREKSDAGTQSGHRKIQRISSTGASDSDTSLSSSSSNYHTSTTTDGPSSRELTPAKTAVRGHSRNSSTSGHVRQSSSSSASALQAPLKDPEAGKVIGKWKFGEILGKGGFGTVVKGINIETGDFCAIKQIEKELVQEDKLAGVLREAELLRQLDHLNIVKLQDFMEDKDYLYFVLEYVESGSLYKLLKKFGTFPESLVALYLTQVLEGLKYLHSKNIIHRDIKGDNILITKSGVAKLADFGTARLDDTEKSFTVVGTPYWMAPEIIEMSNCGTSSDIWSIGCTIIELLTGTPPYFDLGTMSALFNIVQDPHPPLPEGISEELKDFLMKCFLKDTAVRPSAEQLLTHPWIMKFSKKNEPPMKLSDVKGTIKEHNQLSHKKRVTDIDWNSINKVSLASSTITDSSSTASSPKPLSSSRSESTGEKTKTDKRKSNKRKSSKRKSEKRTTDKPKTRDRSATEDMSRKQVIPQSTIDEAVRDRNIVAREVRDAEELLNKVIQERQKLLKKKQLILEFLQIVQQDTDDLVQAEKILEEFNHNYGRNFFEKMARRTKQRSNKIRPSSRAKVKRTKSAHF
jgi:serine/threonine protein kinase